MDEKHKEITHALIDDRVDKITSLVEELEKIRNILMSARDKKRYLSHLNKIAHQDNPVCGVRSTP
jgi:hypothetical protein